MTKRAILGWLGAACCLSWLALAPGCKSGDPSANDAPPAAADGGTADGAVDSSNDPIERTRDGLARKDARIDMNGDGSAILTVTYDASGAIATAAIDTDGDGQPEAAWDLSTTPHTFEQRDAGTLVRRVELTPGGADGSYASVDTRLPLDMTKPAARLSYAFDPKATDVTVTTDVDTNRDGTFDDGTTTETKGTSEPATNASVDAASCTGSGETGGPDLASEMTDALPDIAAGAKCLSGISKTLGAIYAFTVGALQFDFECGDQMEAPTACASSPLAGSPGILLLNAIARVPTLVRIYPLADTTHCAPMGATLFHEIMHHVFGLHAQGDGYTDPTDQVWACESTCFGAPLAASRATCGACLGVGRDGTPPASCNKYPDTACTTAMCRYSDENGNPASKFEPSALECEADCPLGLDNFGDRCAPVGQCHQ